MENENNNTQISTELARTYQRRRRIIWACAFAVLALVVVYMVWCAVHKTGMGITYAVMLSAALAIFWVLTDIVSPIAVHAFDGRSQRQKNAYYKYAALELVGYAGLAYFGICAMSNRSSIYGAVAFLIATVNKRRFLDEYVSDKEDEETDAEDEPQAEAEPADNNENTEEDES